MDLFFVLNLIINGLPSILFVKQLDVPLETCLVLNLIINGLPSIFKEIKNKGTASF